MLYKTTPYTNLCSNSVRKSACHFNHPRRFAAHPLAPAPTQRKLTFALKILAQTPFGRHIEIITQCQPDITEIDPLFDEILRRIPQSAQHMRASDPSAK